MERIVELGTLLAYYGVLLTERQRTILRQAVWEDCSLSEIAEREGMSRQGVHDSIRCADRQLRAYDAKLGLVGRFGDLTRGFDELERFARTMKDDREKEQILGLLSSLRKVLED